MEKGNRQVVVSALQFACTNDVPTNLATAERLVRAAHAKGANIILIQELFEGYYFFQAQREDFFRRAKPYNDHPTFKRGYNISRVSPYPL
ncbi:N-carbamoylputrescine amidase isoform X3 [Gossypium raimondii]|uniref:N-carbamoylputrescine amidase isoform X3 n=1 Tax=Gossypium raimondii TaxID=29730 RepID=UPI00063AD957|nr:N-carbamoylputrescine amidase isoform X3 [Gossypium raimondii]